MSRPALVAVPLALIVAAGLLHGHWTHRWDGWSDARSAEAAGRLTRIPLQVGDWDGVVVEPEKHSLPEELVGRGISVRYTRRTDGVVVTAYVACGPTDACASHVPTVCYPAIGYGRCPPDIRTPVSLAAEGAAGEFWVSGFKKAAGPTTAFVRVFWGYSDGRDGWRTPDNPRRAYRHAPVLFKSYFVRSLAAEDEPVDGDPALQLMALLLPRVDAEVIAGS